MGDLVINKKNGIIELFNTAPFCTVTKAELSRSILSDDYIDITVESSEKLDLNLEDRIIVEGRSYFVNLLPQVKKNAEDSFTHEIRFFGASSILRRNILFNRDSQGGKTGFEFPITAELNAFLYLIINNANEFESNWILGDFPSNTETKSMQFSNENCLAALQRICQEFKVEFEVEETGGKFVLHIREKIGKLLPFKVEYGMGNGLYDLTRARSNDSEVVTILYGYGSSENIPVKYRGYSPRLRMPIAIGDYITNQAAQELFGKVVGVFDPDIKPEFKGIVSGVGSLTNGLQEISVSNMDFDLKEKESDGKTTKYLIAGTPAKISVTKGNLAGYDFEINDYDHSSKTFKLKQFADDRGQKFPDNTTVFKFAAGDEFTLGDIVLPDQYITNAEQRLYDETVKEYQKVSQNNVKYTLNVDPLFLQDKGEIGIGDLLPIKDADFGIDKASRIISLKKDLLTDTYTSFDVADSYEISLVKEIVNNIKDLQKEIASQKVINRQSYLDGYRRVEDRFSMYFDADGKMDGSHIKADTIDVGMLSSGSKSRWFQLEEVVFTPNLGSDPNSFRATAGRLVHFGIKTSSSTERVWNLSALTVNNLLNQGYYVYAKCDINGDYGTFIITPDRIVFDSQPNYYHFLIGNLYTASSGGRAFDANYGVSQMNGRMIFAGVISDIQGRPMIDLDKREIIGKVTFTNDSPALEQVQEKIDAVQVGAVNLIDNSAALPMAPNDIGTGNSVFIDNENEKFLRATPDAGKRISLYGAYHILESNEQYIRGIYVRHSAPTAQDIQIYSHNTTTLNDKTTTVQPNTWTFIKTGVITGIGSESALILQMFMPNIAIDYKKTILVKGNRLGNDWSPSANDVQNEITVAKQNAANAQNTANTAAQNAIDANKKLSDIANDNIVTPQEKPDVLQEYYAAANERNTIIDQAKVYNVDFGAYNNAFVGLDSYLVSVNMFGDMNSNTAVNGAEFKQKYLNYYTERSKLYKLISDAAKNYANGLVNNIKIGGRNTYKKSTPIDTLNVDFQREHVDAPNGFYAVGRNNPDANNVRLWGVIDGNGEWTVSFEMRGTQSVVVGLSVDICDIGLQHFSSTLDNSWKKFSLTINVTNYSSDVYNFVDFSKFEWAYYLIRNIKIERGNKATDWTPAPEDVQEQLTNAQNSANAANQKLADIANDNLLTVSEKPEVIKEWDIIAYEYDKIIAQAATYNTNSGNYTHFFNGLSSYLISINWNNLAFDSPIDGIEFRRKFRDYYTERTDLLKRISDASKGYVDNLQVGSRNLLLESNTQLSQPPGVYRIGGYMTSKLLEVGKTYTLMFKSGNGGRASVGAWINGYQHIGVNEIDGGIKTFTFTVENTGRELNIIDFYKVPDTDTDRWSSVYWAVLVEGNKMGLQSWMPAPEDLEKKITEAQSSANTANQKLSDIASDNKLTPSEKQDTLKEWTVIVNESPIIMDQAATYGVSSTNYEGHYINLSNYLTNNGLLNDLNSTSDIDGATFRLYFKNYYTAKVDLIRNISTASKNYTNQAAGELRNEARLKLLASQYTNGNCLYRDADFRSSLNGLSVYNNSSNGTVELFLWTASAANAPTKSPNMAICRYNGGGAQPYLGGFYFGTPTRANAVFVVRLIMRLDVGYQITFHSNQAGDNYSFDWVTPVDGTGKWEEYIGILRCGAIGTFSSSMFFAILGTNKVIETYIAYASVFDVTDIDKYLEDKIKQNEQQTAIAKAQADNALATANKTAGITNFLSTTVDGNVIASGTMLVGDVTGGNAGITGVTDQGSNSVRIFAGANYANKNKAPLNILDNGLIKMHHPNGNKGFELGIVNGKLVFNVYDDIGNLIMEMGSQGIIFSNYIPDSWTNLKLAKFDSANYSPYDATSVTNFANTNTRQIMVNNPGGIEDAQHWNIHVPKTEASHINYSTYSAGRSYDSNTYVIYEGVYFEGTLQKPQKPNGSIAKLADGWYYNIVFLSVWKKYGDPYQTGAYAYTFQLFRLSAGKVVETKDYTINGQV